ncbi:type VII secretion-associated serine protease mycosin [Streptomyces sp. NPDC018693]|uniref:type VII secretion-associated serine protease mycosin n=1 Tax=unclassified Streptomyces TaxID=2593676 RepID=UPI0037957BF8
MHSSARIRGRHAATVAALALLFVGTAGTPAVADPIREDQWFLDAMKAEEMWRISTGEGITVAVIDSGVDPTNPDLKGRVLPGKDLAANLPGDEHTGYNSHGTGMAGLIAGTGASGGGNGAFGLAPGTKILPIRMPDPLKAANEAAAIRQFNETLPTAIRYAADQDAQVINISLGQQGTSQQVTDAVKYALDKGSLIFAGVGNDGEKGNPVMYPAATPGVVGVAAVGKDLRRTAESEYGPQVDMAAPGDALVYACGGKTGVCEGHGTSGATALASASAALIWSAHPDWTNNQVLRVMLNTIGAPTDGSNRNDAIGYGIVRPRIALTNPGDPGPADEYPLPDLAAAQASPSPKPAITGTPGTSQDIDSGMAVPKPDDDGDVSWLAVGISATVLLCGGIAVAVVALQRRRSQATSSFPSQLPHRPAEFGSPQSGSNQHRPPDHTQGNF